MLHLSFRSSCLYARPFRAPAYPIHASLDYPMNGSLEGGMNGSLFRPMNGYLEGAMISLGYLGEGASVRYSFRYSLGKVLGCVSPLRDLPKGRMDRS